VTTHSTSYLGGMDGLRALAALGVFGVHLNQILDVDLYWGPFDLGLLLINGEVGVALFFVLSGFLLSRPFVAYRTGNGPRPSLRHYAWHRLVRIVPAYYLCLLLLVLINGSWRVPEGQVDLLLHLLFLFNLAEFSTLSINPVFWTLAVEMQFYLVLPLLFLLRGRLWWKLLLIGAAAYVLHVVLNSWLDWQIRWPWSDWQLWLRPHGAMLTHSLFAHLPHFLIGMLLALYQQQRGGPIAKSWANLGFLILMIAFPLILASDAADMLSAPYGRYFLPVVPLMFALLVFFTLHSPFALALLELRPVRYLGRVSYGLYLFHLPAMWWLDRQMLSRQLDAPDHPWVFLALAFLLSVLVAAASYQWLERPLMRRLRYSPPAT